MGQGQCSVEVCERTCYALGLCKGHYDRTRRNGDPGTTAIQPFREGCQVEDCERRHERHGFCKLHYRRWQQHGDTIARKGGKPYMGRTAEQVKARILATILITENGCWEWQQGRTQAGGYSALSWKGISPGHRVSYTVFVGPIPPGMFVCHKCDNPPCINPEHLWADTPHENNADMTRKGRAKRAFVSHPRGEKHHCAKLTDAEVETIRASTDRGVDLAHRYNVSQQLISNIRHGTARRQAAS